jgi:hypothetical protein
MVQKAMFCCFKPDPLDVITAQQRLALQIDGYPPELFAFIETEDVVRNKYFITSYGRVFTVYGRELFPEVFESKENNVIYLRIVFVHRLVAEAFIPKTIDDIQNNRNIVNHKFNRDGRCNYVWNLEWSNLSENTYHGIHSNQVDNIEMYNPSYILDRRDLISYNQNGEANPKSRISEHQAELICFAYTKLGYNIRDCAIYAWLEGTAKDCILVSSIVNGHSWTNVGVKYGIQPAEKTKKNRANPIREEYKEEYENIINSRNYL